MPLDYLADMRVGLEYGIGKALRFTTQDPAFNEEKPDDIHSPKAFIVGERIGEAGAGFLSFVLFGLPTAGIVPLYNYLKYKRK